MKRTKTLIPLSQDHHHGLLLAVLIQKDAPQYKDLPGSTEGKIKYTIIAWKNELSVHFENEEKILFPAIKGKNEELDALITEILKDHKEIEGLIKSVEFADDKIEILDKLGKALKNHIRKEERVLFEKIQTIFTEEELEKMVGKIEPVKKADRC